MQAQRGRDRRRKRGQSRGGAPTPAAPPSKASAGHRAPRVPSPVLAEAGGVRDAQAPLRGSGGRAATPGRCPLWGRRTPGAPGSTPGRRGCGQSPQHSAAALRPVNLLPGLGAARPPTPDSPAPWLLLTLPLSVERPSPAGPGPRPTAPAPPPPPAPAPPHSSLVPPWDSTHPTLWATGLIDSWETKTWQAKRLSRGCLVMKPK